MNLVAALFGAALTAAASVALMASPSSLAAGDEGSRNLTVAMAAPVSAKVQRLALVIGNSAYSNAPLINPVNDARAMSQALQTAGFTVILKTDVDHRTLLDAVREFGNRLRQGGVGVFYYAGHGMQIKGRNYLIPIGADIQREDEVAYAALDAQAVLDKMETASNGTNLMILDACRNNPFARSFRSSVQGLAQMEAPAGTMVAFATAPGGVASDGQGANGLYTQHLLTSMRVPGMKVEDVFKRVRAGVRRDSEGKQVPWEATSLEGDLYFVDPKVVASVTPAAPLPAVLAPPTPTPTPTPTPPPMPMPTPAAAVTKPPPAPIVSAPAVAPASQQSAGAPKPPAPPRPSNRQGFTIGDRWNYQTVDKWKAEVVSNYTHQVGHLERDGSWATPKMGARFDEFGRRTWWQMADGGSRTTTPFLPLAWPDMKVGDKKRFEYESSSTSPSGVVQVNRVDLQGEVRGIESIKVPAGEFQAWRIEYSGSVTPVGFGGYGHTKWIIWYAPELRTMIAKDWESRWNGKLDDRGRDELTSFSLINGAPAR